MSERVFEQLSQVLAERGIEHALDCLIETLHQRGDYRELFDAMILKKRHELGLPLAPRERLGELPEHLQRKFEEHYIEVCRSIGELYLKAGDIPHAWFYLRAIQEPQKVTDAIEKIDPHIASEEIIRIAFQEGVHPRKGFEWVLQQYGTCAAITAFEQLAPAAADVREHCVRLLVRRVHADLVANLKCDITQREGRSPDSEHVPALIESRDWLFGEMNYHIDASHLSSVVRYSRWLSDPEDLSLAVELTDYGRKLDSRLQFSGEAPFEDLYPDHRVYLRALLGDNVEAAIEHFRAKIRRTDADTARRASAEVLIELLSRLGRDQEAIAVWLEHLQEAPLEGTGHLSLAELCRRAGHFGALVETSRQKGDLVNFTAALVEQARKDRAKAPEA